MKKGLLSLLLLILITLFGTICYAETQTLHATKFTSTANVNPNTTDSVWNSTGIIKYEEAGSKVVFDSTDFKQIGEELIKINSDLITMNENITNADTTVLERKKALATKLNALYTEINTLLSTSLPTSYSEVTTFETMAEDLETAKSIVNEKLSQVFKSVSDGKKLVAAAITEKGVTTAEDATYQVMHDNIISMALKQYNAGYGNGYLDGQLSKNTTGKVTYVKHYHTGNSSTNGGCFTISNYHRHVDGLCYYKCGSHSKDDMIRISSEHYSGKGDLTEYYCRNCGIRTNTWSARTEAAQIINNGGGYWSASYIVYRCGKTTNTIDSYSPSCGYTDGQILSATITY